MAALADRVNLRYTAYLLRRNPMFVLGLLIVLGLVLCAILAPLLAPYDPGKIDFKAKHLPPSAEHPFGTNIRGQDIFSQVVYGARMSLMISVVVVVLSLIVGVPTGLIAGYFGGRVDELIMRVTDAFLAFPPMLLPIVIAAALERNLLNGLIAIAVSWFPWYTRILRATVLVTKEELYVESARSIGVRDTLIILRHVLPNSVSPLVIQASMDMGYAILFAAALSFIGLGAKPTDMEWGRMVTSARAEFLDYWWTATFPGLAIFVTVLGFNLIGDGLRDILDPKVRGR
jgi:peptide/nickel transport system permease protein